MKRGPHAVRLDIDVTKPLIFPVPEVPMSARFMSAHAFVKPPRLAGQVPTLGGVLVMFEGPHDGLVEARVFVLVPPDGWIDQDGAEPLGVVVNPLDGMPIVIYSIPEAAVRADPLEEVGPTAMASRARPVIDVPTTSISDLAPISGEIDSDPPDDVDTVH